MQFARSSASPRRPEPPLFAQSRGRRMVHYLIVGWFHSNPLRMRALDRWQRKLPLGRQGLGSRAFCS